MRKPSVICSRVSDAARECWVLYGVDFNEDPDDDMQIEVAEDDSSVFDCSEIYFGASTLCFI